MCSDCVPRDAVFRVQRRYYSSSTFTRAALLLLYVHGRSIIYIYIYISSVATALAQAECTRRGGGVCLMYAHVTRHRRGRRVVVSLTPAVYNENVSRQYLSLRRNILSVCPPPPTPHPHVRRRKSATTHYIVIMSDNTRAVRGSSTIRCDTKKCANHSTPLAAPPYDCCCSPAYTLYIYIYSVSQSSQSSLEPRENTVVEWPSAGHRYPMITNR